MPTPHPAYPGYDIYWQKNNEAPHPGAFFALSGDTRKSLTYVGKCACMGYGKARPDEKGTFYCKGGDAIGAKKWRVINQNAWNMKHLVYRKYSHKWTVSSNPKVDSSLAAATTNPANSGAYISLLRVDTSDYDKALGANHQIVWCPKDCDSNDVPKGRPSRRIDIPTIINKTLVTIKPAEPSKKPSGGGGGGGGGSTLQQPVISDDGWPWWLWLLMAGAGIMGAGAVYKSRKKSQKGKK